MLTELEIFFGDANNAAARVYARLEKSGLPQGCALTGRVVGPSCAYSSTLSATVPFTTKRSVGMPDDAAPLVAEAIVPDPCFWSPELPFLYQAEIELHCGRELLAAADRTFGIRPLGTHKRRIVWEGRPWVLRAADAREVPNRPVADWRVADLAMLVDNPGDDLCREASRFGAVLVADMAESTKLADDLRRLARWPAAAIAVVDASQALEAGPRAAARNLLFAERRGTDLGHSPSPWADLVMCEDASTEVVAARTFGLTLPIIAQRAAGWCDELADARRHCDLLQRDLAGHGDVAGYLV
jgi:hypothetical protein